MECNFSFGIMNGEREIMKSMIVEYEFESKYVMNMLLYEPNHCINDCTIGNVSASNGEPPIRNC